MLMPQHFTYSAPIISPILFTNINNSSKGRQKEVNKGETERKEMKRRRKERKESQEKKKKRQKKKFREYLCGSAG